jgi:dTDP-4-amino-4,6-dideoxygalactose transaminase
LSGVAQVKTPTTDRANEHIFHQYTLRVERRDALHTFLKEREIGSAVYYPLPLHLQPCFSYLGYKPGRLPVTEGAADQVLSLPIYPELSRAQQDWVIESIRAFYA